MSEIDEGPAGRRPPGRVPKHPAPDDDATEEQVQAEMRLRASELPPEERPRLTGRSNGRRGRSGAAESVRVGPLTGDQRLLILDAWQRSGLSAEAFSPLVGVERQTLYAWKHRFDELGPAGLEEHKRGTVTGTRLPDVTQRAILMLKKAHPEWGCQRISDVLWRSQGHAASANAIARFLKGQGYTAPEPEASEPHDPVVHRFERARVNQLWQSDLFTFLLKREARRVYLVAFMDDHSRFIVSWGLHATASGALVRETFLAGVANFGAPQEVLTDNGPQYATWRGTSRFTRLCRQRGVKHLLAHPRRPRTLGKVERFWGSLWRECLEDADIRSLDEARARVGLYIDHYNFHRPHQGLDGLTPADRFFEAAPEVLRTLQARVAPQAGELARHGLPRKSFYLTGRVGDAGISLHAEGERIVLTTEDGVREEVDLSAPGRRALDDAPLDLPAVVTPAAREVLDDDDGEVDEGEVGADPPHTGDAALREPDGEEDGGGDPRGPEWAGDADAGGDEPDALGAALLPARAAGAAGAGGGAGAAVEGASAQPGPADRRTRTGEDPAGAGPAAHAGAAAGRAAGDRGRAAAGGTDPAGAPEATPGDGTGDGGRDGAAGGGGEP